MEQITNELIEELLLYRSHLSFATHILAQYNKVQGEQLRKHVQKGTPISFNQIPASDLSIDPKENRIWNSPLIPVHKINIEDLEQELKGLEYRIAGFTMIRTFEALRRFMEKSIIFYFTKFPDEGREVLSIPQEKNVSNWRIELNRYKKGYRQRSGLELEILGKSSVELNQTIIDNNRDVNLRDYLQTLIDLRDTIVHDDFVIPLDKYNGFQQKDILKRMFLPNVSTKDRSIDISAMKAQHNIKFCAEIAVVIYKSFAGLMELDPKAVFRKLG